MYNKYINKGFRFGMVLQFAVGPVCLYVFQTASIKGFYAGIAAMFGVALVDGLFILAAILGIAAVVGKENIKLGLKFFGAAILFIFGASSILSQFNANVIPVLNISKGSNPFLNAALLTGSSPLTILFWAGVFSSKVTEEAMKKRDVYAFGFGALLSTVFFLTLVSIFGTIAQGFLNNDIIKLLNLTVGILLIYFSFRMLLKKV